MNTSYLNRAKNDRSYLLFVLLCLFSLGVGVIQTNTTFINPLIVMVYEIGYILLHMLLLKEFLPVGPGGAPQHLLAALMFLWAGCVTLSLLYSPYDLVGEPLAWFRYLQTLTHVIFSAYIWAFLRRFEGEILPLLLMLPLASILVLLAFIVSWNTSEQSAMGWFHDPVLNSHIRHTGYQVTAGLAVMIAVLINRKALNKPVLVFASLVVLWGFLFWTGGRAAGLSALFVSGMLLVLSSYKQHEQRYIRYMVVSSATLGILLSELVAVFPWNGILQGLLRSVSAEDFNQFSSNRLLLWETTWNSVKSHILLGLGPQGYFYMPNRIAGVQPHGVVLQFLSEWGIIGSILFVLALGLIFFKGVHDHVVVSKNLSIGKIAAGAVIISLTIHSLVDGTYYHPQPSYYLALAYAIWLQQPTEHSDRAGSSSSARS